MRTDPLLKFETVLGFKLNCPSNARHGLILESKTNNSSHLCDTTLALGAVELWRGCSGPGSAGSVEGSVPI